MTISAHRLARRLLAGLLMFTPPLAALQAEPAQVVAPHPKTLVLVVEGLDHRLVTTLLDEGRLPHLATLAARGSMVPLAPARSAEEPVSFGVLCTGRDPGEFGLDGFVGRTFTPGARGIPIPYPTILASTSVEASRLYPGVTGTLAYPAPTLEGERIWDVLGRAGVRVMALSMPMAYPAEPAAPGVEVLATGPGMPDVGGSPGTWWLLSDDPTLEAPRATMTGGQLLPFRTSTDGTLVATLQGPHELASGAGGDASAPGRPKAWIDVVVRPDRAAGQIELGIGDVTLTLDDDSWSPLVPIPFTLGGVVGVPALARLRLLRCDAEALRLFVTPIGFDPRVEIPHVPLSWPRGFAADLAAAVGPFETVGYAALFNALKDEADSGVGPAAFMAHVDLLLADQRALLREGLRRAGAWDVFLQSVSTLDSVAHVAMRAHDPTHPTHDPAEADLVVGAFGRRFAWRDALVETTIAIDAWIGEILALLDAGAFGPDATLLVVSPYAVAPFHHGVNLNNALLDSGHLVPRRAAGAAQLASGSDNVILSFADWDETRAYSMGLGKIYVNLRGREPQGIVETADYDALVEELRAMLLALRDPETHRPLVAAVHRRDEIFSGPFVDTHTWQRRDVNGVTEEPRHGFADLHVEFAPPYRVSWSNTLGSLDATLVTLNDNAWSGDHVSMSPDAVPGVLVSSRPLAIGERPHLRDVPATLLARYGIDPASAGLRGRAFAWRTR